jgi:hypothetical protein
MTIRPKIPALYLVLATCALAHCGAVELKVSREALERTQINQLFNGPNARYYLKGSSQKTCSTYADDPKLSFLGDRILIRVRIHARLGKAVGGACLGLTLAPTAEVSVAPEGEGENIGFRDARVEKGSDQRELNFLLTPFLPRQVPSAMKVNAAEVLRKALAGSTASSGYSIALEKLKVHSMQVQSDALIVDVDGALSVK